MKDVHILVPELPESIINAKIITWHKKIGDIVHQDEILIDIETEKVILEVPAITNGILSSIIKYEGSIVKSKEILGIIQKKNLQENIKISEQNHFSPSIRKLIAKKDGNIENILKKTTFFNNLNKDNQFNYEKINHPSFNQHTRNTKIVPINPIRKRIAERLLKTINNTAMLTTFNEVNMNSIIKIRKKHSEEFQLQHNIKLGFMSFFVKAVAASLKKFPDVNAKIEQDNIVYYNYFDINIAISTEMGLVTPILKDVNLMSFSEIEKKIKYFLSKGNTGKLELSDLIGGNFTITNGGIFGSLLSTPIINPPQTAILGIHAIQDRPMAINGKIKILPMMYVALSYDHRLIDGKQAVGFLKMIKDILENSSRILLDI